MVEEKYIDKFQEFTIQETTKIIFNNIGCVLCHYCSLGFECLEPSINKRVNKNQIEKCSKYKVSKLYSTVMMSHSIRFDSFLTVGIII